MKSDISLNLIYKRYPFDGKPFTMPELINALIDKFLNRIIKP